MDLLIHNRQSNVLPLSPPPPPSPSADDLVESRISPSILLIIVILAVIFFVSGILHLLVRYLLKPPTYRDADDIDIDATALQGQLQQLFHLHDSGVDQSFIDMLPVFPYKAIIGGVKDPFDCAVCLCEFEPDNKLRLLPKCSHAFHMDCIDTWLLAHSTCPLCRSTLLPADYSPTRCCSPILVLIESAAAGDRASTEMDAVDPHIGHQDSEIGMKEERECAAEETESSETKVVQVKLGKFRSVEGSSNVDSGDSSLDQRRCFSMGTYEYVMNENSLLQVAIKPSKKRRQNGVRHRLAMSECDCHSKRESFKGFGEECGGGSNAKISSSGKRESFSISKTWLRSKKEKPGGTIDADCSRRAFSFRLPALHSESKAKSAVMDADCSRRAFSFRLPALHSESKAKSAVSPRTTASEFDMDTDVEVGSCNNNIVSMGSQIEKTPSFARRTLLWIVGRQNRVGSSMS